MRGRCLCDYVGSMTQRNTALSAIVGIVVCGLVGCAAEGAPAQPSTQVIESVAAEPSSTYTIPPRPAMEPPAEPELTGVDVYNAYDLAKFYLALYPYVKATGDTELWEKYAHPDCEYCQTVLEAAVEDNKTGAWTDFAYEVLGEAGFSAKGEFDYRIDLLIDRKMIRYYGVDGVEETEPGQHNVVIGIKDVDGRLLVRYFDRLKPELFGKVDL